MEDLDRKGGRPALDGASSAGTADGFLERLVRVHSLHLYLSPSLLHARLENAAAGFTSPHVPHSCATPRSADSESRAQLDAVHVCWNTVAWISQAGQIKITSAPLLGTAHIGNTGGHQTCTDSYVEDVEGDQLTRLGNACSLE